MYQPVNLLFSKTLALAVSLNDQALEAQACYSLGNTYTLMCDYDHAIEYHVRHLRIARHLGDRVGEARACWSLGNAYAAQHRNDLALHYTTLHLEISREVLRYTICFSTRDVGKELALLQTGWKKVYRCLVISYFKLMDPRSSLWSRMTRSLAMVKYITLKLIAKNAKKWSNCSYCESIKPITVRR